MMVARPAAITVISVLIASACSADFSGPAGPSPRPGGANPSGPTSAEPVDVKDGRGGDIGEASPPPATGPAPSGPAEDDVPAPARTGPSDLERAFHFAPIIWQDTDDDRYRADQITSFDFDGNWAGRDNWDHLDSYHLPGAVYYSVVESPSYWFIVYTLYHPQDWVDDDIPYEPDGEAHENDAEGLLAVVRKDGSEYGVLDGIITTFHSDFYSYRTGGSPLTDGAEDLDGLILLQTYAGSRRPVIAVEAKGHGIKAWPPHEDFDGDPLEDAIIYRPTTSAGRRAETEPSPDLQGNDRSVQYRLVDVWTLWERQLEEAPGACPIVGECTRTFAGWGAFAGDRSSGCGYTGFDCPRDAANAPWGWDDGNDSPSRGELALDPMHVVQDYFGGVLADKRYMRNRFIEDLQARWTPDSIRSLIGFPGGLDVEGLFATV